ncbi:MAG: hypothetical protein ACR2PL_28050 [Dehalococcoidia bacterium]
MSPAIRKIVVALLKPARCSASRRSQKNYHDLRGLDEHTLRDIGVNRFGIIVGV